MSDSHGISSLSLRLAEAIAWWSRERPLTMDSEGTLHRRGPLAVGEDRAADDTAAAVDEIVRTRAELLRARGWDAESERVSVSGRLLLLLTAHNLMDGAAAVESRGFFGDLNFPPCDLWLGLVATQVGDPDRRDDFPTLVSWIPEELVTIAQRGVDANPERCLVWADELAPELHAKLLGSRR